MYAIFNPDEGEDGLWWSNKDGWGSYSTATLFGSIEEIGMLPMGRSLIMKICIKESSLRQVSINHNG